MIGGPDVNGGKAEACGDASWVWVFGSIASGGGAIGGPICHAYSLDNPGPGGGSFPDGERRLHERFLALSISSVHPTYSGSKLSRASVCSARCSVCVA